MPTDTTIARHDDFRDLAREHLAMSEAELREEVATLRTLLTIQCETTSELFKVAADLAIRLKETELKRSELSYEYHQLRDRVMANDVFYAEAQTIPRLVTPRYSGKTFGRVSRTLRRLQSMRPQA